MPRQRKSRPGRKPQLPDNIVRKEGTQNLYGRIQIGKLRKRFSLGTPDVDEAKRVLQKKIDEAWDDHLDGRDRVTFSQQFTRVYPRRWASLKTAEWHKDMHDAVVATLGDFYLDEVSEDWCWEYIGERRQKGSRANVVSPKPVSDGTINKEMAFVKRVMLTVDEAKVKMPIKKQVDQRGAPTYPIVKIKRKKSEETVTNPLRDEAEAMELIAELVPHARPIVMTLLLTGLRKENVMTLDIKKNLRWNERQIIVRQKGDTDHVIGMSDDLYHLLREVCGERTRGPVFVFGINGCDCMHCAEFTKQKAVSVPRRVRCVETGEVFNSAAEAVRKMKAAGHSGVNANQIGVICRGGKAKGGSNRDGTPKKAFYTVTTSGGFCWEYAAPLAQPAVKKQPNKQRKTGRIKSIDGTFNTAREQIGRPELRIHDLRHTFGTWLNARGTDINKVKEAMGHSDIVSTQRYLHVGVDEVREELNKNIRFNISAPRE